MAKKAAKKSARRKKAPGKKKNKGAFAGSTATAAATSDAAQDAASQRFVGDLLCAAKLRESDSQGKVPLHATHVIKGKKPDGTRGRQANPLQSLLRQLASSGWIVTQKLFPCRKLLHQL